MGMFPITQNMVHILVYCTALLRSIPTNHRNSDTDNRCLLIEPVTVKLIHIIFCVVMAVLVKKERQ